MKITYINEAVRLPSKEQKKVTVDDIHNVNLPYIKTQMLKDINSELVACASKFGNIEDMLIPAYKDENGNIDFSFAINVESDLDVPHKFCIAITVCVEHRYSFSKDLLLTEKSFAVYIMLNEMFKRITKKYNDISKVIVRPMWLNTYDSDIMKIFCGGTLQKQELYNAMWGVPVSAFKPKQINGIKIYMSHNGLSYDGKKKHNEYLTEHINDLFEFVDNVLKSCNLSDDLSLKIIDTDKYIGSSTEWLECICKSNISLKFNYVCVYDTYKMYKPFVFNSSNEILNIAKDKETFYIECDTTQLFNFMKKHKGLYIKSPDSLMFLTNIEHAYSDLVKNAMADTSVDIIYYPIDSSFHMRYIKNDVEINIDTIVDYIIEENNINVNTFFSEIYSYQRETLTRMIKTGISDVCSAYNKIQANSHSNIH